MIHCILDLPGLTWYTLQHINDPKFVLIILWNINVTDVLPLQKDTILTLISLREGSCLLAGSSCDMVSVLNDLIQT